MRRLAILAVAASASVVSLFYVADAYGHAHLTTPLRRANCQGADDTTCKEPPQGTADPGGCGGTPNPAVTPTVMYVGSSYTIGWDETIDHASTYRLAISTNGETGFDAFVIMPVGTVADEVGPTSYVYAWTAPDTQNCDPCVMQLIQDMGAENYYNCADIRILPAGSTPPPPTPTPSATPTNPSNPNDPVEVDAYGSCSCSVEGGVAAGSTVAPVILLALAMLRRRRAR